MKKFKSISIVRNISALNQIVDSESRPVLGNSHPKVISDALSLTNLLYFILSFQSLHYHFIYIILLPALKETRLNISSHDKDAYSNLRSQKNQDFSTTRYASVLQQTIQTFSPLQIGNTHSQPNMPNLTTAILSLITVYTHSPSFMRNSISFSYARRNLSCLISFTLTSLQIC